MRAGRGVVLTLAWVGTWALGAPATLAQENDAYARVKWEEARLAIEAKDYQAALPLYEELMELLGPIPELQYNAARAAFELGEFDKARTYIYRVFDTDDTDFRASPEYQESFRLAAQIQRATKKRAEQRERERLAEAERRRQEAAEAEQATERRAAERRAAELRQLPSAIIIRQLLQARSRGAILALRGEHSHTTDLFRNWHARLEAPPTWGCMVTQSRTEGWVHVSCTIPTRNRFPDRATADAKYSQLKQIISEFAAGYARFSETPYGPKSFGGAHWFEKTFVGRLNRGHEISLRLYGTDGTGWRLQLVRTVER